VVSYLEVGSWNGGEWEVFSLLPSWFSSPILRELSVCPSQGGYVISFVLENLGDDGVWVMGMVSRNLTC